MNKNYIGYTTIIKGQSFYARGYQVVMSDVTPLRRSKRSIVRNKTKLISDRTAEATRTDSHEFTPASNHRSSRIIATTSKTNSSASRVKKDTQENPEHLSRDSIEKNNSPQELLNTPIRPEQERPPREMNNARHGREVSERTFWSAPVARMI
jgi:hypothetical protein